MRRPKSLLLVAALAAAACRGPRPEVENARCTHVRAERPVRGVAVCEDAWSCTRPPDDRFDQVGLRRVAACNAGPGPVVLYFPGMHMNSERIGDARTDLLVYLAQAGVRTWAFDYRTHAVPADATTAALEPLRGWTAELFARDAAWAAGFVASIDRGPLFLAGFSYGGMLAYRLAGTSAGIAGLVILDATAGPMHPPAGAGPVIDVGSPRLPFSERARLLEAVAADPTGPSPLPGYPSAGAALADILYTSASFGGQGGLSDAKEGVADIQLLAQLLRTYDRWWPRAALEAKVSARRAPLPVLAFSSANMGPEWIEHVRASATAFGGPGATVHVLPLHGHIDVLVGRRAPQQVYEPVRAWLMQAVGRGD